MNQNEPIYWIKATWFNYMNQNDPNHLNESEQTDALQWMRMNQLNVKNLNKKNSLKEIKTIWFT